MHKNVNYKEGGSDPEKMSYQSTKKKKDTKQK